MNEGGDESLESGPFRPQRKSHLGSVWATRHRVVDDGGQGQQGQPVTDQERHRTPDLPTLEMDGK